ncbi:MAG: glycosyltransferase family 4 protein [Chromatiales bacterium]|jgi:glycosyltransferase involved in cell wall biosynthesis|nr:glycosyltransferase family 4 protein [Chromatiales bacterium]
MRILFHHRIRSKDGQFVHLEELTRALEREGHEVLIVGPAAVQTEQFGSDAGIVDLLKRFLPKALYEALEFAYSVPAYFRLMRAIRSFRPDVVYERYQLFFPTGVWATRRSRLPMLLEVNAPLLQERAKHSGGIALQQLASWSERYVWNAAAYCLPVTRVLADMVQATGVPDERLKVIPNGIDFSRFDGAPGREEAKARRGLQGRLVLGFVGFIRDWHGLERVLQYVAAHPEQNASVLLVGDGPARSDLEALAAQLGITDRVQVTGIVQRDEVAQWLAAFDIALQPDVTAYASPLKLFEYMYCGLPVIAPDTPNIREILANGGNGLLFDRGKPGDFERAMAELVADGTLRERLGAAARQTILDRDLTWQGNARRVVELAQAARTASTRA